MDPFFPKLKLYLHGYIANYDEVDPFWQLTGDALARRLWERFERVYTAPTPRESSLILPFLYRLEIECGLPLEDRFIRLEETLGVPDLKDKVLNLIRQVRESKGYEVTLDTFVDFSIIPEWSHYNVFIPRFPRRGTVWSGSDETMHEVAKEGVDFAIMGINNERRMQGLTRVRYERINNFVTTNTNLYLLSFAVFDAENPAQTYRIRAMVKPHNFVLFPSRPPNPPRRMTLLEWKYY